MATASMRSSKIQEFVAHKSNVNCVALGQISGRVLVTGGDDKKVNLWAIGTSSCVLSLHAESSPVECVKFGLTEEFVCSGSQAGEINIWDLEANKKTRNFVGHKDAIRCMDFHPYGDFLASGALDTSIKLWDLRRRGCISSYKGHTLTVNSLRFSPDGLWLASGGEDGLVKLWDVRVGRQLEELGPQAHRGPVFAVEFHPHEFLLASGSGDRTVRFWDLEKFSLVSSTEKDVAPIRCLQFSQEGECLFAGLENSLRVLAWEPSCTLDGIVVDWGQVKDTVKTHTQLIGASCNKSKVLLHAVDLKKVSTRREASKNNNPFAHGQSLRKSFSKDRTSGGSRLSLRAMDTPSPPLEVDEPFQATRTLNRTPPPLLELEPEPDPESESLSTHYETDSSVQRLHSPTSDQEPLSLSSLDSLPRPQRGPSPPHTATGSTGGSGAPPGGLTGRRGSATLSKPRREMEGSPRRRNDLPNKMNNIRHSPSDPSLHRPPPRTRKHSHPAEEPPPRQLQPPRPRPPLTPLTPRLKPAPSVPATPSPVTAPSSPGVEFYTPCVPAERKKGIDVEDFLPQGSSPLHPAPLSESEVLSSLHLGHSSMMLVLSTRQRQLQLVFAQWRSKDVRAAVDCAVQTGDLAVAVDLFNVLVLRPTVWSLDVCGGVLPCVADLLESKYELYMGTGCTALTLILRNFAHIIKTNVQAPIQTVGVDISREERYNKCIKCYKSLMSIRSFLLKRQTVQGKMGHSFRELLILMEGLE